MQYVACEKSADRVWFVKIIERCEADQPYTDDMAFQLQKANNFQWKIFGTSWQNKTQNIFSRNEENHVFLQDQCCLPFCQPEKKLNL